MMPVPAHILCFGLFFWAAFYPGSPYAAPEKNSAPLEITADGTLEWHRNELFFKANENVIAKQNDTTLHSDTLIAHYRKSPARNIDIHTIEAQGHVRILSPDNQAYGEKAVYDIETGIAVMTGDDLKLVSGNTTTVTAQDELRYHMRTNRLEAIGQAHAVHEGDQIRSDRLIAVFTQDERGKRTLQTLEAIGHVVIITPTEVLTGERALYTAGTQIAELSGNVRITKGNDVLEGARAQVNLQTNVSTIFGAQDKENGRVRAIFHPKTSTFD